MIDYVTYAAMGSIIEPQNFVEAVNCNDCVDCNGDETKLSTKWIFKLKYEDHGKVERYRARLVERGCTQRSNIDYNETYSPLIRYSLLRYLFSLAVEFNLGINNKCVHCPQGNLVEEVFIEALESFGIPDRKTLKLNRPIYGFKQSSRMWNLKLSDKLRNLSIYINIGNGSIFILANYVDDIIIFWNSKQQKNRLIKKLKDAFKLRDLGNAKSFLRLRIERTNDCLTIVQSAYTSIQKLLQRISMTTSNPTSTPMDVNITLSKEKCPQSEVYYSQHN